MKKRILKSFFFFLALRKKKYKAKKTHDYMKHKCDQLKNKRHNYQRCENPFVCENQKEDEICYSFHQFPTRWYKPSKEELDYFARNRLRIKRHVFHILKTQDIHPHAIASWEFGGMTFGEICLFFLLERRNKRLLKKARQQ